MKARKAQATGIATFIFVLALFMLVYILLLPEKDRQDLLDIKNETSSSSEETAEGQQNLLYTSPGQVYTSEKNELNIPINSVSLFAKTEDTVNELATKITVSKSWFSDKKEILTFKIDDPEVLEKLQLFFFVNSGEGMIYVQFNGYTVFEGEISSSDSPISLPLDRAKKTNLITIGMSSGDFAGDKYSLSSVAIKQSAKSEKNIEGRTFQLTTGEKAGLKKASLTYFVNCAKVDPEAQGDLSITLNGKELLTERVFCDAGTQVHTLSSNYFAEGRNSLEFKINKGEYTIEGIEINVETRDKYYPQYNFELSDEDYEATREDGDKDAYIIFKFPSKEDRKKAAVTINEYQVSFDTQEDSYERKISSYLERGTNYIKIVPKLSFEISSMKVYVTDSEEED
ncbi:hypothetical protein FJZ53_02800 [Candidatus Woesearchaeota archaeon]|nr:hypothetical protein [Candidatus Woesearchaeota archaeon]